MVSCAPSQGRAALAECWVRASSVGAEKIVWFTGLATGGCDHERLFDFGGGYCCDCVWFEAEAVREEGCLARERIIYIDWFGRQCFVAVYRIDCLSIAFYVVVEAALVITSLRLDKES